MIHSLFNGERVFRGLSFRIDEFVHGVTAKEMHVRNIFATLRNCRFFSVFVYGDESYDLIVRSFGVKLNLTVLIGYAERFNRGLPRVDSYAVIIHFFTERFRPDLAIPVREVFKPVGIRHHNGNVFTSLHGDILQNRVHKRRVFAEIFIHGNSRHIRRAG